MVERRPLPECKGPGMGGHPQGPVGSQPVVVSPAWLLGDGARREPFDHGDGKPGGRMERVVIDGETFVLKYLHAADDRVMRATGDVAGQPITSWQAGWLDRLPACLDHAVVGAAWDEQPDGRGGAPLMRDVGPWLVPEGDDEIPLDQHSTFIDYMAKLHVSFWGCRDTLGLLLLPDRFRWFGPGLADAVFDLFDDPTPLVAGLEATPQTLDHGDWKAGNPGSHPDGRIILLDRAIPGVGPGAADIAWYVCLNRARLPRSKDDALGTYRAALERHGVDTAPWWERPAMDAAERS